ncbi:MAG: antibiotic biosynthesis monooxygenase family protein [bacterium]
MIRSIIRLNVALGREREFEETFQKRRVLERAKEAARLRTGELLRPVLAGGDYIVVATWDTTADYQAWVDSPVRAELASMQPRLSEPVAPADLYEIVDRFGYPARER